MQLAPQHRSCCRRSIAPGLYMASANRMALLVCNFNHATRVKRVEAYGDLARIISRRIGRCDLYNHATLPNRRNKLALRLRRRLRLRSGGGGREGVFDRCRGPRNAPSSLDGLGTPVVIASISRPSGIRVPNTISLVSPPARSPVITAGPEWRARPEGMGAPRLLCWKAADDARVCIIRRAICY